MRKKHLEAHMSKTKKDKTIRKEGLTLKKMTELYNEIAKETCKKHKFYMCYICKPKKEKKKKQLTRHKKTINKSALKTPKRINTMDKQELTDKRKDKTIRACKCQCHCEFCSNTVSCDFGHDENTTCEHCNPNPKKEKCTDYTEDGVNIHQSNGICDHIIESQKTTEGWEKTISKILSKLWTDLYGEEQPSFIDHRSIAFIDAQEELNDFRATERQKERREVVRRVEEVLIKGKGLHPQTKQNWLKLKKEFNILRLTTTNY